MANSISSISTLRPVLLLIFLFCLFIAGCGNDNQSKTETAAQPNQGQSAHIFQDQEPFKDWVRERYGDIVFIHPPNHLHQEKFVEFARVFSALQKQTRALLRLGPIDSTVIYFYTGVGQGMQITQQSTPFSDGHVIHFWFPSYYGPPIVKHLLPLWSKEEPRHKFLKDGLIALLDGTANNYHQATLKFIDSGKFISLQKLSVDTSINVDMERYQSAEAASFVDYIVYSQGIDKFKELYESKGAFSAEVERIFMAPQSELQKRWLAFIKTFGGDKTSAKDTKEPIPIDQDSGQ